LSDENLTGDEFVMVGSSIAVGKSGKSEEGISLSKQKSEHRITFETDGELNEPKNFKNKGRNLHIELVE